MAVENGIVSQKQDNPGVEDNKVGGPPRVGCSRTCGSYPEDPKPDEKNGDTGLCCKSRGILLSTDRVG